MFSSQSRNQCPMVTVDIGGGHSVTVVQDGFFDRYRMNPDLDEIAKNSLVGEIGFFRQLPKSRLTASFGTWYTPNFYYQLASARLTMLAPVHAIAARLPRTLSPLEVAPGLGIVFASFFRYDVCDIDPYNEVALSAAVKSAQNKSKLGLTELLAGLSSNHFHTYILSLPVTTDIACVLGREVYGLPKWCTGIDVDITVEHTHALISNNNGETDVYFSTPTPKQTHFSSGKRIAASTFYSEVNRTWQSTFTQTNIISTGSKPFPRRMTVQMGSGPFSDELRSLKIYAIVQLEISMNSQMALHMPIPIVIPQP